MESGCIKKKEIKVSLVKSSTLSEYDAKLVDPADDWVE